MYFVIFSYGLYFHRTFLSLTLTFITVFLSICYDYVLSFKSFTVFFFAQLLIVYLKTFPLEMREGSVE